MKVKIISTPITPYGSFEKGQQISSPQYPEAFLKHLVNDCNAAVFIDEIKPEIQEKMVEKPVENKMEVPVITNKQVNTTKKKSKKKKHS